jgi:hypothetical protein
LKYNHTGLYYFALRGLLHAGSQAAYLKKKKKTAQQQNIEKFPKKKESKKPSKLICYHTQNLDILFIPHPFYILLGKKIYSIYTLSPPLTTPLYHPLLYRIRILPFCMRYPAPPSAL